LPSGQLGRGKLPFPKLPHPSKLLTPPFGQATWRVGESCLPKYAATPLTPLGRGGGVGEGKGKVAFGF